MTYYKFDEKAVSNALDAARTTHEGIQRSATESDFNIMKAGSLLVHAECISVKTEKQKVCLDLPLGLGKHCISIPISFPDGTVAKACLHICTTWGIPTGVKISIEIGGITVISQTFGKC